MREIENNVGETTASGDAASQVHAGLSMNDSGTCEKIDTPLTQPGSLHVPANFDNYRARQNLIAKRNATDDPVQRERLNLLIEQMNEHDKCAPDDHERRTLLRRRIMAQMALVAF